MSSVATCAALRLPKLDSLRRRRLDRSSRSERIKRVGWILLAPLVGACGAESDGDSSIDAQAVGPLTGYVDVGGINLHYRDYGGTGNLLVFVPGFYMTAHVYDELAPYFTDRYRVLALTYRGHGSSDTTGLDFDLDTLARDVAVIGVLAGNLDQRADGMYAWRPPSGTRAEARFLAWYDSAAVYDSLDLPVLAIQVHQGNALATDYEARGLPEDTIDLALRWVREYYNVSLDQGIDALQAAVPDAEVVVLDDLNHNYMIENPEVVAPIIGDFLDRLEKRGQARR